MMYSNFLFALVCFISFTLTACRQNVQEKTKSGSFELSAWPGGIKYLDTIQTIHIGTTLFNPTEDTLRFVTMTCSYEDLFLTDTSVFTVQSRYDCFSNYPIVASVPPKGKVDQYIMIRPTNKDIAIASSKLKIGMYLLTPKLENSSASIIKQYQERQRATIIWSNEIDLKRLYRNIYR